MIKTAFVVLISSLFIVNRETAHLCLLLGTYTGMLLIPPLTEFQILNTGWQSSLYLHLGERVKILVDNFQYLDVKHINRLLLMRGAYRSDVFHANTMVTGGNTSAVKRPRGYV